MFDGVGDSARDKRAKPFLEIVMVHQSVTSRGRIARAGEFALIFMNAKVKKLRWTAELSIKLPWKNRGTREGEEGVSQCYK